MAVHIVISHRGDGDFHLGDRAVLDPDLVARRRRLVDLPWSQPDEVHGTTVLEVTRPGEHDRAVADALVTRCDRAVLGIWVGDCAPVALVGDDGTIAGVHAGWRGAVDGVLPAAIDTMRSLGAREVTAVLGPCIHPCCYAFSAADLDPIVERFGPDVESVTRRGERALDMRALVAASLGTSGVGVDDRSSCTGCHADRWFSHRIRGERQRQVMAVWRA